MENYLPHDLTAKARDIVTAFPEHISTYTTYGAIPRRIPLLPPFHTASKGPVGRGIRAIQTPLTPDIEIGDIEQIVDAGQVRTCAEALRYIARGIYHEKKNLTMKEWSTVLEGVMDNEGIDSLHTEGWVMGDMVKIRGVELMAVVNRLRGLKVKKA